MRGFCQDIDAIKCGYLEVMLQYGPGAVAGGIGVIHPREVESVTEEAKEYLLKDANIPDDIPGDWFERFVVLGRGPERRYLLYLPEMKEQLIIYDGDDDELYINPWGFSDPRYGFNAHSFFYGRDYELIFDSLLNRRAIQVVRRGDDAIRTIDVVGPAMARWFVPGDMIRGDLQSEGVSCIYLSKLGGYIDISNETDWSVVDLMTLDFDLSEEANVEDFIEIVASGYEIIRF